MTDYHIGADYCGVGEANAMRKIAAELKKLGDNVDIGSIGPNQEGYAHSVSKSKTFLYLVCGVGPATIWSFKQAVASGTIPKTIFVHSGWSSNKSSSSPMRSEEAMLSYSFIPEWDSGQFMSSSSIAAMKADAGSAKTVGEYCKKYSNYVGVLWANSPEEAAQKLHNGQTTGYGGGASSGTGGSDGANGGSSTGSASNVSPLLQGEMTFEELVGEICNGIDLQFITKRGTVVVDDFESIFAEAKYLRDRHSEVVKSEDIQLWQLEQDSYELEVNQHGFYNTVYVHYKNGVVKESYDEFVRVYGKIPIHYKHPNLDKTNAIAKAKAYLAAHIRDFGMTVNLSMLADGDIDIGDIITVENPKTMNNENRIAQGRDPEYLFVNGKSISWDDNSYISASLECVYAPTSPQKLEVPTSGTASNSGSSDSSSGGTSGGSGSFNSCGVSSDGKTICAIGKPSAGGELAKYGYTLYRSVFERKCPFCGSSELYWGYMWEGTFPCTKKYNNGTDGRYEGHIYCDGCDADFSCIEGKDHMSPPRATLTRADSGPVKCTENDANQLKKGQYSI